MSYAATHRHHHVHVPWLTIVVVAAAVAVCAAVLILINQPATQTATAPVEVAPVAVSAGAAAVPAPESPALRRHFATDLSGRVAQSEQFTYPRNHVKGATLDPGSGVALPAASLAIRMAPNDPHPLNHFPSEP